MALNIETIVIGIVALGAIAMFIVVYKHYKKKKHEEAERRIQQLKMQQVKKAHNQIKQKAPERKQLVLDKTVIVKRPGKKVTFYGRNDGLIAWCMQRKNIRYSEARLECSEYIEHRNQPGRKKARGYWQFTIKYAA